MANYYAEGKKITLKHPDFFKHFDLNTRHVGTTYIPKKGADKSKVWVNEKKLNTERK